jgi:hypothetical protein
MNSSTTNYGIPASNTQSSVSLKGLSNLALWRKFKGNYLQYILCIVVMFLSVVTLTHADSLRVGGYDDRPSNLDETFGVFGDLDENFASDNGRTDRFAYRLTLVDKGYNWGSCAICINRDIRAYRSLSFWVRSPQGANLAIGLTDAYGGNVPTFAKPLNAYLPTGTSNEWKQVVIPLKDFKNAILKKTANLVFEVGTRTVGNNYGYAVFIDDICLLDSGSDIPKNPEHKVNDNSAQERFGVRNVETNLKWIRQMIHPRTGLLQSSTVARESSTFVCATALHALLEQNDLQTAMRIGDVLKSRQNRDGSWPGGWDYATGTVITPNKRVGEVAWASMTLLELHAKTHKAKYLRAALQGVEWTSKFQILDPSSEMYGAYRGGKDVEKDADFQWISAEHQADTLSLLFNAGKVTGKIEYFARAKLVTDWIMKRAWDEREGRFRVGFDMDRTGHWQASTWDEPTDVQAWLPMALAATHEGNITHTNNPADFTHGIEWLLQFQKTVLYEGKTVHGFSTKPFKPASSINTDHMLYVIMAARIFGKVEIVNRYAIELDKVRNPENGLLDVWMIGPADSGQPLDFRWPHATAISFDTMQRNPFALDVSGSLPEPKDVHEATERLAQSYRKRFDLR